MYEGRTEKSDTWGTHEAGGCRGCSGEGKIFAKALPRIWSTMGWEYPFRTEGTVEKGITEDQSKKYAFQMLNGIWNHGNTVTRSVKGWGGGSHEDE